MTKPKTNTHSEQEIYQIQEDQYDFPYHFIPHIDQLGSARRKRTLAWGYEYLCYMQHISDFICRMKPASVLDVGCGEGRLLNMVGDAVAHRVGVDLSERAIAYAKAFTPNAFFYVCDAGGIDEKFDVVTAVQVLEHIPDDSVTDFLQMLAKRVVPGGHLLICVPTIIQPINAKHYRHYTRSLFEEQMRASNLPLKLTETQYLVSDGLLLRAYRRSKILQALLDCSFLRRAFWNHYWNQLRIASEDRGRHVLFVLRRPAEQP